MRNEHIVLTRTHIEGEILNHWCTYLIGGDGPKSCDFIREKPLLPSLEEFVDQTSTHAFLMGKYYLWDCLRANCDITNLKEFKKSRDVLDDAETRTYESIRREVNRALVKWTKESY
jgi:hypothetical protein